MHAEEDAAQGDVSFHTRQGTVGVAIEDDMLVAIDRGEEEPCLTPDELLLASLPAPLGEL